MASRSDQQSRLHQSLTFATSGVKVPNRLMKAALTERLASWDIHSRGSCGVPSHELVQLYKAWGSSGYGMVITGNIMVDIMNLEAAGNMIIPAGEPMAGLRFESFCDLAREGQRHGSLLLGQISHAGRQAKAELQPEPISASAIALGENALAKANTPRAATLDDIATIIENFAHSAAYLARAGFAGVQLHAAHGYLLSQFLSKTANARTDAYGATSMADRARLIVQIAAQIRARTPPSFVLGIKINSVEFEDDGWQPADAAALGAILDAAGFDFVELSGGTYRKPAMLHARESTRRREAFFIEFAEQITRAWRPRRARVYVTGGLQSAAAMQSALETVDGVGLGRPATASMALARDLVEGRVERAPRVCVPLDDYGASAAICGSQMRQVGEGRAPMDGSMEEVVRAFFAELGEYVEAQAKDRELKLYKWMQWTAPGAVPARHWSEDA